MSLQGKLEDIAAGAPGTLGIYVKEVSTGREYARLADERFPLASVLKVPLLVELLRQVRHGRMSLEERIELKADHISPGSGFLKDIKPGLQPTVYDLALLMITQSDNTATDMLAELVGIENVNRSMDELGLHQVRVTMDCKTLHYNIVDLGGPGRRPGLDLVAEYERRVALNQRNKQALTYSDSLENNVGTPRELAQLLEYIHKGEAFDRVSCDIALEMMRRQQVRDRLPRLLPEGAVLAHKTGSIWGVRNDIGILYTDRGPVIIACLSKGAGGNTDQTTVAIAQVGRTVWDHFSA